MTQEDRQCLEDLLYLRQRRDERIRAEMQRALDETLRRMARLPAYYKTTAQGQMLLPLR